MIKEPIALISSLFVVALVLSVPLTCRSQNREKFVISARAGGVNAVTGRATMRAHGNSEWQQLTIKEDLETGDVVRTGHDGRMEMLLNPGSYMRLGENSEFELADSSLENLEVRLIRGTAVVEVTGADDTELLISITTPHTRMAIVRRGLYRVNVVPGNATELIVRKGRVMLDDSHTKVKGGNKVIFSGNSFSVAKLEKADKQDLDAFEGWSKDRAKTLAKANSKLSERQLNSLVSSFRNDWRLSQMWGRQGVWLFNPASGVYTFLPFSYGWGSPYGGTYSRFFYGGGYYWGPGIYGRPVFTGPTTGSSTGPGNVIPGGARRNPLPPAGSAERPVPIQSPGRPNRPAGGRVRAPVDP